MHHVIKIFFSAFIMLYQFLGSAEAQNTTTNKFEGIILYYETDSIPQEVFLLPCKIEYSGSFTDFVIKSLRDHQGELIEIYFQGMRWSMPNLFSLVQQMNYIKGKRVIVNNDFIPLRISAGIIFADASFSVKNQNYNENRTKFIVQIDSAQIDLMIVDYDREKNGLPFLFEPLYFK